MNEIIKKIEEEIKGIIPQYHHAAKILATGAIYTRTAPQYNYRDLVANRGAAYIWEDNQLITVAHNITTHRLCNVVCAYHDWKKGIIPIIVWENYITNGYNTRRGLYASYTEAQIEKMKNIGRSHADWAGNETGISSVDHRVRVAMRNN